MNKAIFLLFLLTISLFSCKNSEKEVDKLGLAREYFQALNHSDGAEMRVLLADSLFTVIPKYDYSVTFSVDDYVGSWLKWDSVFDPTYKILEIELGNDIVKATVSKIDQRIQFLQQEPFITNETLRFDKNKIVTVETEYVNFNEKIWDKNRTALLEWVEENHPELNGFIYDQTEAGGIKYLKAIELYKNKSNN